MSDNITIRESVTNFLAPTCEEFNKQIELYLTSIFSRLENDETCQLSLYPKGMGYPEDKNNFSNAEIDMATAYCVSYEQDKELHLAINPVIDKGELKYAHIEDVNRILWIPFDLDPDRPKGTSATLEQRQSSIDYCKRIYAHLIEDLALSPDNMMAACSGNGSYLLVGIDAPNNQETAKKLNQVYNYINEKFKAEYPSITNERILAPNKNLRVIGCMNHKGAGQRSYLLHYPESLVPCDLDKLSEQLPDILPIEATKKPVEAIRKPVEATEGIAGGIAQDSKGKESELIKWRTFDHYPDFSFSDKANPCPCCNMSVREKKHNKCVTLSNAEGIEFGLCWSHRAFSRLGTEGLDYQIMNFRDDTFGTALFRLDRNPLYEMRSKTKGIDPNDILWDCSEDPDSIQNFINSIEENYIEIPKTEVIKPSPATNNPCFSKTLRKGLLRDLTNYFASNFAMDKNDTAAFAAALSLISHLNHNVLYLKEGSKIKTRLNTWMLLIAPSSGGKSHLFDMIEEIYNKTVNKVGVNAEYFEHTKRQKELEQAKKQAVNNTVEETNKDPQIGSLWGDTDTDKKDGNKEDNKNIDKEVEEIDPPQYYQLPIVSDITSEGLLDYIIKAPIKMITYTADEFMKFFRVANYREQISKMFLTLNSGKVPSTLYLKNKGVKTFNGRLQFNILTQTTSVALLEDLKKYPDYLGNGFLGRFCYIYDDTNDFEAIHNLHNDILKERLLNPDLVSRLEQEYLDSEDCQITEKLDMLYQYLIKNCSKLWRIIEKCKDSCLVPWSDYHSYSYEKFSDLRSKLDTASPYHKAIYDRSFTKTLKMAAIIELSHIKDSPSGWDLNTISVTQESYDEAFDFVVPETIKIIEKIDGSFGYSKEKEYTDKLLRSLKKHWTDKGSSIKKEFVCDSKNKKLVAIKRSDMMYKTGLSASTINIAIQNLQDLELIDLVTEKVNGRNTQLIVLREGA